MPAHDPGPAFRALHKPGQPFILANAWDIGSAKMLAGLGAEAIATSSAAHAFTLGRADGGTLTRDEALAHGADLVAATPLPVSGDFENGFGHTPEDCAETVRLSVEAGLAGLSIEDTALPDFTSYGFEEAVERIRAAAAAARAAPRDIVLCARADGVMIGQYDMEEAMRRCLAYAEAGADCVYTPLPPSMEDLARLCAASPVPVNALAAGPVFTAPTKADYAKAGVARISLGSALARITHRAIYDASRAMFGDGDFTPLGHSIGGGKVNALLD